MDLPRAIGAGVLLLGALSCSSDPVPDGDPGSGGFPGFPSGGAFGAGGSGPAAGGVSGGAPSAGGTSGTGGMGGAGAPGGAGGARDVRDAGTDPGDASVMDAAVLVDGTAPHADGAPPSDGAAPPEDAGRRYDPCPPKGTPCRILPLGDSITWGQGSTTLGGYRAPLFALAHAAGKALTFVGPVETGPTTVDGVPFPRANAGYPGFTIGALQFISTGMVTAQKPHIITLMIGTNDITTFGTGLDTQLGGLLDRLIGEDPTVLVVVAQITPSNDDGRNVTTQAYNASIPAVLKARADAGKHVALVDMYGAFVAEPSFKTAYLSDAVHPNDAGYAKMADVWYAAIGPLLR